MQVLARVRQGHLAGLHRMLKVVMASARANETPAIRFKVANNLARVLSQGSPQNSQRKSTQCADADVAGQR